ncbi:hypothetical protein AOLI_G00072280 [Acnodon oligacanthus]
MSCDLLQVGLYCAVQGQQVGFARCLERVSSSREAATVISLPEGQQRAIKGAVVSVPSDVETTVNVLPRPRSKSQLLTVKLKRRLCYTGHYQFQTISMEKVLSALLKLKEMHSEYRNIVINNVDPDELFDDPANDSDEDNNDPMDAENNTGREDTPQQNPESEQHNADNEGECTEQQAGLSLDTCLQPPDLGQHLLSYNDGVFCIAPAESSNPVSIFKVPKLEAMAFPVQFPTGENTFDEPHRHAARSPSRYFNARPFSADNRFAWDTNYIFFAQFVTEMYLATSSMSIQLRKAKSMTRDGRRINSALLQDKQELDKLVRNNEGTRFMQPLRGTPAYWEKTLRDLFAMLRQLGTPTFFCTFCAAEMRWPEVITAIKAQQGETVDFSALDWSEKCEILCSNPVTAMRMFEKRVEALMNLIQSPAQPTDDNAVRMSLPMKCLQDKDPDDENVWMTGLAEKYMARPNTPEFENMCMAEFASEYRIVYAEQRKGKNVSVLQNNMGQIKKSTRGKPAIIRFARFSQQKHPEKFYGTVLKLYLPHQSSAQLKTAQFNTYGSFYAFASVKLPGTETLQCVYTIVNENREKYEKHSEAIEQAIENFEQNGPIEDAWTNLAPTNELIRLECMIEQEPTDPTDITEQDDVPDYAASTSENRTAMPLMEAPQMSSAEIRKMYQSLNETQAAVFYSICDWCKRKVLNLNPEQFFYYVAGTAGTGKSHLIKSV